MGQHFADIGLPKIKQIAQHKKLCITVLDIIEKPIKLLSLVVCRKVVPRPAVADMKVTDNDNVSCGTQWMLSLSFNFNGLILLLYAADVKRMILTDEGLYGTILQK